MKDISNFTIFAHARSGSTSLANVLGASNDVNMAIEPFHADYSKWNPTEKDYSKFIVDNSTMDISLNEIFSKYSAIKILQYQFDQSIYFHLLKNSDLKIIFLRRKNLIQGAISALVAEQTNVWKKEDLKKMNQDVYNNLKPIKIEKVKKWVEYVEENLEEYEQFLDENKENQYIKLFYEELYSENLDENRIKIKNICEFLSIEIPPKEAIVKYMTPSNEKIDWDGLYELIPNYDELKAEFGDSLN